MKKTIVYKMISLALMMMMGARAELMISAVQYDPEGSDSGFEWIELYNPDKETDLTGYSIEKGNGAAEDDWETVWEGDGHIRSGSYYLIGESKVRPAPDSVAVLRLQNGPDACRLLKDGRVVDTVGWGEHTFEEYYEASPAVDSSAIVRINMTDTDNNSFDFIHKKTYIPHPQTSSTILFRYEIVSAVTLESVSITDDDPNTEGYQISPTPGSIRSIPVNLTFTGNGCEDIVPRLYLKEQEYTAALTGHNISCTYQTALLMDYTSAPGTYRIDIDYGQERITTEFDYLPMTGFMIDSGSLDFGKANAGDVLRISGDTSLETPERPTLHNIGNTNISFDMMLMMDIDNSEMIWNISTRSLAPGMKAGMTLTLDIKDDAEPGIYTGEMVILGERS